MIYCINSALPAAFTIVAGEHDLKLDSGLEQTRGIAKFIPHEDYGAARTINDISLILVNSINQYYSPYSHYNSLFIELYSPLDLNLVRE